MHPTVSAYPEKYHPMQKFRKLLPLKCLIFFQLIILTRCRKNSVILIKTIGGVPRLDGTYTVFGEVTEGTDVVDKIAAVSTDSNDRPFNDVRILNIKIVSK